jgi:hypothetical protein
VASMIRGDRAAEDPAEERFLRFDRGGRHGRLIRRRRPGREPWAPPAARGGTRRTMGGRSCGTTEKQEFGALKPTFPHMDIVVLSLGSGYRPSRPVGRRARRGAQRILVEQVQRVPDGARNVVEPTPREELDDESQ